MFKTTSQNRAPSNGSESSIFANAKTSTSMGEDRGCRYMSEDIIWHEGEGVGEGEKEEDETKGISMEAVSR